ncbi:hypothetical protein DPMN_047988 [Dreissena polymorpha]|uniref:Uncharacterized protein n=1 Tax=Dreissena polymorpha TaxID=45954 RepID=A0A9D4I3K4_DREPO|nr:hypothetical protein DPMN_047988 [Dreissena polymorpha]
MMTMQDPSGHRLKFLFTLKKSPTQHHLHPLSPSHLQLDFQHQYKNLQEQLPPATPLFDEFPAPAPLSPLPSGTSTLQDLPLATPNYAPPSPLKDDLQTPVPASPLQSNTLQDLPPATPNYAPPSPLQDDLQIPVPASPLQSNTLQDLPPATPTPLDQDELYTIATPTPAANMYKPTPSAKLLRFKARSMLVDGNMPLYPSAKRDWATVEEESILVLPNLLWPPKNWRRLTPDQRLLAVEFASMSLTQTENNSSLLLPERSFLIHNFHFLVLPGSAGFPLDNKAKARLYTYQSLLDIANGKDQSPLANQTGLLKALLSSRSLQRSWKKSVTFLLECKYYFKVKIFKMDCVFQDKLQTEYKCVRINIIILVLTDGRTNGPT